MYVTEVGESFYNFRIPHTVVTMKEKGLLVEDGMPIARLEAFPIPLIMQKYDGGIGSTSLLVALSLLLLEVHQ